MAGDADAPAPDDDRLRGRRLFGFLACPAAHRDERCADGDERRAERVERGLSADDRLPA
jgi:hypothetical protein